MQDKTEAATQKTQIPGIEEEKIVQLIVFNLGDEEFAVEIGEVKEIIKSETITHLPDSPEFIKGIINVRGNIIAVIDLKARFFLRPKKVDEDKHIIITRNNFGILVNEVTEISRLPETDINEAPELVTKIHEEYIKGVITGNNRLIILLDLAEVLSEEELLKLSEFSRRHTKTAERQKKHESTEDRGKQKSEKNISPKGETKKETLKTSEKSEEGKGSTPDKPKKSVSEKGKKLERKG